jgi:hypothetical protein
MVLSLSLGEPRPIRFGPLLTLFFNDLPAKLAKTLMHIPKDIVATLAKTRGRRVAREDSVNRKRCPDHTLIA